MSFSKELSIPHFQQDITGNGSLEQEKQQPLRVFVAEDEKSATMLLQATFGLVPNVTAEFSENGADTLARLRAAKEDGNKFNLLITDYGLIDGRVGVEVARTAKNEQLTDATILLTGSARDFADKTSEELAEMGLIRVWGKPIRPSQIMKEVEEFRPKPRSSQE